MRRRLLTLAGFVTGAVAGTAAYRRLLGRNEEQLELYFDDGSFVTFGSGSSEAARLLPLAQQVLTAAGNAGGKAAGVRPEDRSAEGDPRARRG
jgi:outer membrane lipoprotein SlyB